MHLLMLDPLQGSSVKYRLNVRYQGPLFLKSLTSGAFKTNEVVGVRSTCANPVAPTLLGHVDTM